MDSERIKELELLDRDHFWFKAKSEYLRNLITEPGSLILDIGCGSGGNMTPFIEQNYKVIGIDINERSITACKKKGYNAIQADLEKEIPDIQFTPDYITAFDFFEHIRNPIALLSNIIKLSGPETQLIVTVPSYQSLFSTWDEAMGHVKRYRLPTLCNELQKAGWQVSYASYIHMLPLIPAIFMRKIIHPIIQNFQQGKTSNREDFFTLPPILNNFIYRMYYPEFIFFQMGKRLPFGLSALAVAKPQKT